MPSQLEIIQNRAAAPIVVLAAIINFSCILVCLRVPFHEFGYTLAIVFSIGLLASLVVKRLAAAAMTVCVAVGASVAVRWVLAATVWRKCPGGFGMNYFTDSWAYAALSGYLWHNPLGAQGGLSVIDQYASHMQGGRFASASLLNFISVFVRPGDPAAGMLLFFGVCCVVLFFSVLFLSRRLGLSSMASWIAATLSVTTGWYFNAVLVSNFDNIIFLALFTTLLGFLLGTAGDVRWTHLDFLAMALLAPACFYTYPEGFPLSAVLALPILTVCLRRALSTPRTVIRAALLALVSVLIASPYLGIGLAFLRHQVSFGSGASRPGVGNFEGLLTHSFLPAAFALGEEYPATSLSFVHLLVALGLLGLVVAGVKRVYRLNRGLAYVPIPLLALCLWQGWFAHYAYGFFKILFLAVWWFAPVMAVGIECAAEKTLPHWRTAGAVVLATVLVAVVWTGRVHYLSHMPWMEARCISADSDLKELQRTTAGAPVILAVDNDFDYQWAAYYLRDADVLTPAPRGYLAMPHVQGLLANARKPRGDRQPFKLVSGQRTGAIWSNGTFSLVPGDTSEILRVSNPNGVEVLGNDQFFWLGTKPATLVISAGRAGAALLMAKEFLFGPSVPGLPFRNLVTECGQHRTESRLTAGAKGIPIQFDIGTQECRVWCNDIPSVLKQPNGDTRPLLLGIKGYYIGNASDRPGDATRPDAASSPVLAGVSKLAQVRAPNGVEAVGGDQFFWLGTAPVTLVIDAGRPGPALLRAKEFWFGPSAPNLSYRTLVTECGQHRAEYRFTPDSVGIPLRLNRGTQECRIWCKDTPSVLRQPNNGDTRVLLLGLKGYYIGDVPGRGH